MSQNEGGWCVTISADDIEESDLDGDDAVRTYVSIETPDHA